MEFWGVEVKGDKPVKVVPQMSEVVHLSHATLVEIKKGGEPMMLYAKIGSQKLVIGVLKGDSIPQLSFDLVFEKEFELSHNWKNGSVHLTGYKSIMSDDDYEVYSDFSDEEEPLELEDKKENGIVSAPAASKGKAATLAAKTVQEVKEESDDDDDDDKDDDESDGASAESDEDDESDEEMADSDEDDSDEDESDEEDEETPVKSAADKKRPSSALKTPDAKKAKIITPQKTDGGKKSVSGHVATPHPAKKSAKSPKSDAQVSCGSCKKDFSSQGALESHNKAKHSAAK